MIYYDGMSAKESNFLDNLNISFVCIFMVESILKIMAY